MSFAFCDENYDGDDDADVDVHIQVVGTSYERESLEMLELVLILDCRHHFD